MKTIALDFAGYWTEAGEKMITSSGVYCVYRCIDKGERVSIKELVYIGEAQNVKARIEQHISEEDLNSCLHYGECLCFSNAQVEAQDRERAEAALIYYCKPRLNEQHKNSFGDYPETRIVTSGKNCFLDQEFIVKQPD